MKLIGCFGQLASGKDELCNYLVKSLNNRASCSIWQRKAFATAVKQVFCDAFGVDFDFIEEWKRKSEIPPGMKKPVRQGLQFIGDGFRQIQDDIWIEKALKDDGYYCISDGRYINEAKMIKKKGGINILLYRPGYLNDDQNASEAEIRPLVEWCRDNKKDGQILWKNDVWDVVLPSGIECFDLFVINDGSLQKLHNKIERIVVPHIIEVRRGQI